MCRVKSLSVLFVVIPILCMQCMTMTIFVSSTTKYQFPVEVRGDALVSDLARAFAKYTTTPSQRYWIQYGGTILEGNMPLSDAGIGPETNVEAVTEDLSGISDLISELSFSEKELNELLYRLRDQPSNNKYLTITKRGYWSAYQEPEVPGVYKFRGIGGIPSYTAMTWNNFSTIYSCAMRLPESIFNVRDYNCCVYYLYPK